LSWLSGGERLCLAISPSGLPFNELRSCAGDPNRPRASRVALRPDARQRWRTFLANHREVIAAIRRMGIEPKQITARSPWQNGVAERFVGTARHDLLVSRWA